MKRLVQHSLRRADSETFQVGRWQRGSPAVASDGTIYCTPCGYEGVLYLKAIFASGEEKWLFEMRDSQSSMKGRPAVSKDGTVFTVSSDTTEEGFANVLYAFQPDGQLLWNYRRVSRSDHGYNPVIGADGNIFCILAGSLCAVTHEGVLAWELPTNSFDPARIAVSESGIIYLYDDFSRFHERRSCLKAISPQGEILWTLQAPYDPQEVEKLTRERLTQKNDAVKGANIQSFIHHSPPRFQGYPAFSVDGSVYAVTSDRYLYAISPNGEILWRFALEQTDDTSPAVASNGTIFIGSQVGLSAVSGHGELLWVVKDHFSTTPVVNAKDRIYIGEMHNFSAFDPDGSLVWKEPIRGIPGGLPALTRDGGVCVTTDWGYIHRMH